MHSICFDFLTLIDIKEMWLPSVVTYPLFWGGCYVLIFVLIHYLGFMGLFSAL